MPSQQLQLDTQTSILFVGNSFTFGRVDPVMSYNSDKVHDLTAPSNGGTFTNTTGTNSYEPHPWGGVPGIFKQFTLEAGINYDVSLSTRNAASLEGHYLNSGAGGWDLRGNVASRAWDKLVLQDNSTQALPSGSGSVTFAAGSTTAILTLTPVADTKVEADETVGLTLSAGSNYRVGTSGKVIGTILNDDPSGPSYNPALPTVTLDANPSAVLEDSGGKLVYIFTRTGPTTAPLTINFAATRDGSTAPSVATNSSGDFVVQGSSIYKFESGGAATAGNVSFTSNTGSITIAAGATTATLTLLPKADTTVEPDESMRFTLSANSAYNVGTQGAVTATILNDDFPAGTDLSQPNVTLSLAKSSIFEDGTEKLVYQFNRTGSNSAPLTINFKVDGTATLAGNDFTVSGADTFQTGGAAKPDLASFNTYAVKLAQYATTGAADGSIPANANANRATDVFLYETWARPNLVTGALVANTDPTTGAITNTSTNAAEYYTTLEAMTADLRAAYEGLAAANPIFKGVAPVGAAFLAAVQNGTAIRDPYTTPPGTGGKVDLWWDDNLHASKYGSYLSALTLFATITGIDPRSMGAGDKAATDLGIDSAVATALQNIAAATTGFSLQAHWTAPGQVTELTGSAAALLASAGSFGFSDTDVTAVHSVSSAAVNADTWGTLAATLQSDSTGDGSGGAVDWTYTVDNFKIKALAQGETKVETFAVTLADQNGHSVQKLISVTINGTNDAPTVSASAHGTAYQYGHSISVDALANATDVDHGAALSVVDLPATLPAGVSYDATTHSFIFDPTNAAYQGPLPGGSVNITVSYAVSDGIAAPVAASANFTLLPDTVPPSLQADAASVTGFTTRLTGNVLTNDSDAAPLHVGSVSLPGRPNSMIPMSGSVTVRGEHGDLTLGSNGSYSYRPIKAGHDVFVETVTDAAGNSSQTNLTFDIAKPQPSDAASFGFRLTEASFNFSDGHDLMVAPDGRSYDLTGVGTVAFTDGSVVEKDGSPLVDDLFYYAHNPDVWRAGMDADAHYAQFGWKEGCDPNALFSTRSYLAANPDVAAVGMNPLDHYDTYGWKEGRSPGQDFSAETYLARHPDVAAAGMDPLLHYLEYGMSEGRTADSGFRIGADGHHLYGDFDATFYLAQNPDVAAVAAAIGRRPDTFALTHYLTYGASEGRDPSALFSTHGYLAANPDVAAAGMNPLLHYMEFGWKEQRDITGSNQTLPFPTYHLGADGLQADPLADYLLTHL